jgi:hypothetical protein
VTPPQLAWHVVQGGSLEAAASGYCHFCGGRLVGTPGPVRKNNTWMEEHQVRARESRLACEACGWALSEPGRRLLSSSIKRARVISPSRGLADYTDRDIERLLEDMERGFTPPYLFFIREGGMYRRHVILETAVSWSGRGWLTVVGNDDNFTFPADLAKLARTAREIAARREAAPKLFVERRNPFLRAADCLAQALVRAGKTAKGGEI